MNAASVGVVKYTNVKLKQVVIRSLCVCLKRANWLHMLDYMPVIRQLPIKTFKKPTLQHHLCLFRENVNFMTYMCAPIQTAYTPHFYPPRWRAGCPRSLFPGLITDCGFHRVEEVKKNSLVGPMSTITHPDPARRREPQWPSTETIPASLWASLTLLEIERHDFLKRANLLLNKGQTRKEKQRKPQE